MVRLLASQQNSAATFEAVLSGRSE